FLKKRKRNILTPRTGPGNPLEAAGKISFSAHGILVRREAPPGGAWIKIESDLPVGRANHFAMMAQGPFMTALWWAGWRRPPWLDLSSEARRAEEEERRRTP